MQYFLHKAQLHVSALDNGHLHVVHERLIEKLYNIHGLFIWGSEGIKWARDLVDTRTRAHFTPSLPHISSPCMFCVTA